MRRRIVLLVVSTMAVLAVAGGVAFAAVIEGTRGDDRLRGTDAADTISALGGQDAIFALRGADTLDGGPGNDFISAGPRQEGARDTIQGGFGDDEIRAFNRPAKTPPGAPARNHTRPTGRPPPGRRPFFVPRQTLGYRHQGWLSGPGADLAALKPESLP